jgi:hypothetical protein
VEVNSLGPLVIEVTDDNHQAVKQLTEDRLDEFYLGELLDAFPGVPPVVLVPMGDNTTLRFCEELSRKNEGKVVVGKEPADPLARMVFLGEEAITLTEEWLVVPFRVADAASIDLYLFCEEDSKRSRKQLKQVLEDAVENGCEAVGCRDRVVMEVATSLDIPVLFEAPDAVVHPMVTTRQVLCFGRGDKIVVLGTTTCST